MRLGRVEIRRVPLVNDAVVADHQEDFGAVGGEGIAQLVEPGRRHALALGFRRFPFERLRAEAGGREDQPNKNSLHQKLILSDICWMRGSRALLSWPKAVLTRLPFASNCAVVFTPVNWV